MRNLVIDVGNTRIKAAVFQDGQMVLDSTLDHMAGLLVFSKNQLFDHAMVSSVSYPELDLRQKLDFHFWFLNQETHLPIENLYATPETLGVDRKAAVIGARDKIPHGPVLTVDLGSCITYDFLNERNQYLGGAISPGVKMRFKAMHDQTARLPLVNFGKDLEINLVGNSTEKGLQSGVFHGIKFEIEGFIQSLNRHHQELKVIICGGDSKFFESLTKGHIFVIPNLVLFGLNRILTYNVNKK